MASWIASRDVCPRCRSESALLHDLPCVAHARYQKNKTWDKAIYSQLERVLDLRVGLRGMNTGTAVDSDDVERALR